MKTLFLHGDVYTPSGPAQAFCVENGRFTRVGTDQAVRSLREEGDEVIDLSGRFVSPGFNDSHMHLLGFGSSLLSAQLSSATGSLSALLSAVRDFACSHPPRPGQWLRGRGWNQDYFADVSRMPTRFDLDAVSTSFPIALSRACGHVWCVNSLALRLSGITSDTPDPPGGAIGRDGGVPNGLLFDNAIDLAQRRIPAPTESDIQDMLIQAQAACHAYGLTSVQTDDYCVFPGLPPQAVDRAYLSLEKAGLLTLRVREQANFTTLPALRAFVEEEMPSLPETGRFVIGPLKLLGDGSLGGRTAHLSRPYADDPATSGFSLFTPDEMNALVSYAHAHGMQIAVHAIGDRCLDRVLDALSAAQAAHPRPDERHGIVHCQITRPDQLRRIADMGLVVYAQPIFLDYDNHIVLSRVGETLASSSYSWRTLSSLGVPVSGGSDCPVEPPDVMRGIQCAVTRASLDGAGPYLPGEAFTPEEALDLFTSGSAYMSFEEGEKGKIFPGMLADFTVLSQSPLAVHPADIHSIQVLETWVGGQNVYRRD